MKYIIYCRKSTEDDSKQIQSLEDQEEILLALAKHENLEIIEVIKESKSAKAPGRPLFNYMLNEISSGKAQGVICYKLDRLARNPVCGGSINWMLQQSIIQKIVTPNRTYLPHDNVLMMSVEFGMANQFIKDLKDTTSRGMKKKCKSGWLPRRAPSGYINNRIREPHEPAIIKDPERFALIRKMWDLMLTGQHSIQNVCDIANKEWGYMSLPSKKCPSRPMALSTLHHIFTNSFYYGVFEWGGEMYQGKHEPMVTEEEYDIVQKILGDRGRPRPKSKQFTYRGCS